MSQKENKCETPDTFICEDSEEEIPKLCELDRSKTYKGLVGIYVDESKITYIDGKEGKPYHNIGEGSLIFSPDSKRLAYVAMGSNRDFVVVNENEGKQYETIFTSSMGGGRIIFDSPDSFHYFAVLGSGIYLVEENIKLGVIK